MGDVPPVQDDDARRPGVSPLPEAQPRGEENQPAPIDLLESAQPPLARILPPRAPRVKRPYALTRDTGRLVYALRCSSDEVLYAIAKELRESEHVGVFQDQLRTHIQASLFLGRGNDGTRAQHCLAILLGKEPREERKEPMHIDKTKAESLLGLLAQRPDKADLIEQLAKDAGWLPSPSSAQEKKEVQEEKPKRRRAPVKKDTAEKKESPRSEGAKKGWAGLSPKQRKERVNKAAEARRKKKEEEKAKAPVKEAAE